MADKTVLLSPLKNFYNSEHGKLMEPDGPAFHASEDYARHLKTHHMATNFTGDAQAEKAAEPLPPKPEEPEKVEDVAAVGVQPTEIDDLRRVVAEGTTVQAEAPDAKAAAAPENKMQPEPANKAQKAPAPRKPRAAPSEAK